MLFNKTTQTSTSENDQISPDLQNSDSLNQVLPHIKEADVRILLKLLSSYIETKAAIEGYDLVITDLGCAEGQMLMTLLKTLHENIGNYLNLQITIYGCEPNKESRAKFLKTLNTKFGSPERESFLRGVKLIEEDDIAQCKLEEYKPKKSDVFLFSHSLYYQQSFWNTKRFPDILPQDHLLTKFIQELKEDGRLCIVLQSSKPTNETNKFGKDVPNLESFEEVMYPILSKYLDGPIATISSKQDTADNSLVNKDRETFTNSEIFEECLRVYNTKIGDSLIIENDKTVAIINLGEINLTNPDADTGKYIQEKSAENFLNFYTRKKYNKFKGQDQKKILDFLAENCITINNSVIMCHVNQVFVVTPQTNIVCARGLNYT